MDNDQWGSLGETYRWKTGTVKQKSSWEQEVSKSIWPAESLRQASILERDNFICYDRNRKQKSTKKQNITGK